MLRCTALINECIRKGQVHKIICTITRTRTRTSSKDYKRYNVPMAPPTTFRPRHQLGRELLLRTVPCFILRICHSCSPAVTTHGDAERVDHTRAEIDKGNIRLYVECPASGTSSSNETPSVSCESLILVIGRKWPIAMIYFVHKTAKWKRTQSITD